MSSGSLPPGQSRGAPKSSAPAARPVSASTPASAVTPQGGGAKSGWQRVPPTAARPASMQLPSTNRAPDAAPAMRPQEQLARSGEGASTAFFGQPAWGNRIAFILDTSGSMSGPRWTACQRELAAALAALPPEAEFFVVLFSDRIAQPPEQSGWTHCRPELIARVTDWAAAWTPVGGTYPRPAFDCVFGLPQRPDVVYFLTDGQFSEPTPADVAAINSGTGLGKWMHAAARLFGATKAPEATINTLTLDDAASAGVMAQIAADSGGSYAHAVSDEGPM